MRPKQNALKTAINVIACAALVLGVMARAEEQKAEAKKTDPTGTWTWTTPARNGGPDRTNTLSLKLEGDKLDGKLTAPGRGGQVNETAITDGKVNGIEISFTVTREFNGNTFTSKYAGKLDGNTIKGTITSDRNGETQTRDWEAGRSAVKTDKAEKSVKPDTK